MTDHSSSGEERTDSGLDSMEACETEHTKAFDPRPSILFRVATEKSLKGRCPIADDQI